LRPSFPIAEESFIIYAAKQLKAAGIPSPALDARLLLAYILKLPMEKIISGDFSLNETQKEEYRKLILRRKNREPVSHIIGIREFWGMEFKVTKDTLDPRPDSETLIETALHYFPLYCHSSAGGDPYSRVEEIHNRPSQPVVMDSRLRGNDTLRELRILDLGTGTGCLLLSLLKEFPHSSGFAVDISAAALIVAKENSVKHGLCERAKFISGCWGEGLAEKFDLIVSNPPYIKKSELESLAPEVAFHEPEIALDGGDDGLACYRQIMPDIARLLKPDGIALLEIGQGQDLENIIKENNLSLLSKHNDLAGITRCLALKLQ